MQDAMAKRAAASASAKTGSPDSLVQWLDPNEFKIGADDDANAKPSPPRRSLRRRIPRRPIAVASAKPDEVKPAFQGAPALANAGATVDPPHATPPAIRMPTTPLRFFPAALIRPNRESPNA